MVQSKIILHIDMNSFYASVEQKYNPELKGKAVAIAGNPKERRGIVITCSYEARAKGIYTTQRVSEALQKCPELIVLPPQFDRYRAASQDFYQLLKEYTDLVEPVSIDESYVDLTGVEDSRHPMEIVQEIQNRILQELGLPCSIGVAPNKFLAKMASDFKKPLGITILRKRDIAAALWSMPIEEMHGVGKKTAEKLHALQIETIEQLAKADKQKLEQLLGINGIRLIDQANGMDPRPVNPDIIYDIKSVGNSTTLPNDVSNLDVLKDTIYSLCEKVSERLKGKGLVGNTIGIQIKYGDWKNQTNTKTVNNPIDDVSLLFSYAWSLFEEHWRERPVRLLGVTVGNVMEKKDSTEQLSIFNFEQHVREEPILQLMHQLEKQFGEGVIQRGIPVKKVKKYYANTSFSKDFLDDLK